MTPAEQRYALAGVQVRIARAQLLRQIARDGVAVADLLRFARIVGDETEADTLAAFRAAQSDQLQAAQAELDRLSAHAFDPEVLPAEMWPAC